MPRWDNAKKRFVSGDSVTPASSAARGASGNSGWLNAEDIRLLVLTLAVTAASGTAPTLDVIVETADAAGANIRSLGSFAQKTGVATERKSFSGLDAQYRVAWTIGGSASPSFTFSVSGEGK